MQQDHGRAGSVGCIPYPSTVMFHIALIVCDWKRRGAIRFKLDEVVIIIRWLISYFFSCSVKDGFHVCSPSHC